MSDSEASKELNVDICVKCGSQPCEWVEFGEEITEISNDRYNKIDDDTYRGPDGDIVNVNIVRKYLYKLFIYLKYGHLGKGNRIQISTCVMDKIREMFPEKDGMYLGYYEE